MTKADSKRKAKNLAQPLDIGAHWFVQLPSTIKLIRVEVIAITQRTVVLQELPDIARPRISDLFDRARFERADIKFVERVVPPKTLAPLATIDTRRIAS